MIMPIINLLIVPIILIALYKIYKSETKLVTLAKSLVVVSFIIFSFYHLERWERKNIIESIDVSDIVQLK